MIIVIGQCQSIVLIMHTVMYVMLHFAPVVDLCFVCFDSGKRLHSVCAGVVKVICTRHVICI